MEKTIRQMIISDEEVSRMIKDIEYYPEVIRNSQVDLMTAEKVLADFQNNGIKVLKEEKDRIEAELAYLILMDKEQFKNEAQRKAAINDSLNNSEEYKKVISDIRNAEIKQAELQQNITLAKIEVEHARNMFIVWQRQADMIAGLSREQSQKVTFNHVMELKS